MSNSCRNHIALNSYERCSSVQNRSTAESCRIRRISICYLDLVPFEVLRDRVSFFFVFLMVEEDLLDLEPLDDEDLELLLDLALLLKD